MTKLEELTLTNFPLVDAAKKSFLASIKACQAIEKSDGKLHKALNEKNPQ